MYIPVPASSTARLVKEAGADSFLVLPGRGPLTKEVIDLKTASEVLNSQCQEAKQLEDYDFRVVLPQTLKDQRFQPKTYAICPTAFLKPLIGVDGEVYPCTYMRGKPEFSIAQLSENYSFTHFWSSEERIVKLLKINPSQICSGIVCTRHTLNTTLCALRQCAAAPWCDLTSLLKSTDSSLWF